MFRQYRVFVYFLGALVVGSIVLNWILDSARVDQPPKIAGFGAEEPAPPSAVPSPADASTRPDTASAASPYAPSHADFSSHEETSEQEPPAATTSSARPYVLPPGQTPPPDAATSSGEESQLSAPDRDQYTTSPRSSNAALRETLKEKAHR